MAILVLEDNKHRIAYFREHFPEAIIRDNTEEFIKDLMASDHKDDEVWLDHDLGGEIYVDSELRNCGMEVVRFLEREPMKIKRIFVHSHNTYAAKVMVSRLRAAGYAAYRHPFSLNMFI